MDKMKRSNWGLVDDIVCDYTNSARNDWTRSLSWLTASFRSHRTVLSRELAGRNYSFWRLYALKGKDINEKLKE